MNKGSVIELTVSKLAYKGKGIAYTSDGYPIFIPRVIPGQTILARIQKKKKRYAEASLVEILTPSALERTPLCPHTAHCGGCTFQTLPYTEQAAAKEEFVRDALTHIGGLEEALVHMHPIVPAEKETGYRNKMEYSFGVDTFHDASTFEEKKAAGTLDDGQYLGLHIPGSFSKIQHITKCILQENLGDTLRNTIYDWAVAQGIPMYNPRTHEGILRAVVIRIGTNTKEVLCNLATAWDIGETPSEMVALGETLAAQCAEAGYTLAGFVHTSNQSKNDSLPGNPFEVLLGNDHLHDTLGGVQYRISPFSFFQVNTPMAEQLYAHIASLLPATDKLILDCYCGTGSIGLYVAAQGHQVLGIERHTPSVEDARHNAALNDNSTIEFIAGTVEGVIGTEECPTAAIGAVIVDPPREGLHQDVVEFLGSIQVPRLVYVSCNPATLARDCKALVEHGYTISHIQSFDLFPQTYHVETVVCLEGHPKETVETTL